MEDIHEQLAQHDLLPGQHLVDSGYVYTETLVRSRERYQIDLFGPVARGPAEGKRLDHDLFLIDWKNQRVCCPMGCHSERWEMAHDRHGKEMIRVQFSRQDCQGCELHDQCTKSRARVLLLRPNEQAYQALRQARQRQQTPEFRKTYAKRAGVEGTIAEASTNL